MKYPIKYPRIKFVKKANMYCLTYWDENGDQQRKWFTTYEKAHEEYGEKLNAMNQQNI